MYDHLISASLSVSGGHSSEACIKSVSFVIAIKNQKKVPADIFSQEISF